MPPKFSSLVPEGFSYPSSILTLRIGNRVICMFQSIMGQVAKRASVLKRRKSKNKMDASSSSTTTIASDGNTATTNATTMTMSVSTMATATITTTASTTSNVVTSSSERRGSEGDLVYYIEEPKSGNFTFSRRSSVGLKFAENSRS